MSVESALQELTEAGAVFSVQMPGAHVSVGEAARRLDCSVKWVKKHIDEFPRVWRMAGGELRIPVADISDMAKRNAIRRQ